MLRAGGGILVLICPTGGRGGGISDGGMGSRFLMQDNLDSLGLGSGTGRRADVNVQGV